MKLGPRVNTFRRENHSSVGHPIQAGRKPVAEQRSSVSHEENDESQPILYTP